MSPHYQLGMLNLWEWHELGAHVNNVNSGWRIMLMEFRTTNFDHHKNTVNFYHLKSLKKVWYYFPGITEKRQQCLQIVLIVWLLWLIVNSTKTLVSGQMHPFASVLQILQMENLVLLQRTRKGKIAKASVVIHCCCKGWKASQSNILPVKLIICICGSFNWQGLLELMFDLRLDIRKNAFETFRYHEHLSSHALWEHLYMSFFLPYVILFNMQLIPPDRGYMRMIWDMNSMIQNKRLSLM